MITELTRMWLTRPQSPSFLKTNTIRSCPFLTVTAWGCTSISPSAGASAASVPTARLLYSEEACSRYIDASIREIHLAGSQAPGKKTVTSLYFSGGTPALAADRIKEIIDAIQEHFIITQGIGIELHPENVTPGPSIS